MKSNELIVGCQYADKTGNNVREIINIKGGWILYRCIKGTGSRSSTVKNCWITTMMDWAKTRLEVPDEKD